MSTATEALDYPDRLTLASTEAMAVLTDGGVVTANGLHRIARAWDVTRSDLFARMWPDTSFGR